MQSSHSPALDSYLDSSDWRRGAAAVLIIVSAAVAPTLALAHSPIDGFEGFYTGAAHPLVTVDQLLALLGLGVMLGLQWPGDFDLAFPSFAGSMLLGVVTGQLIGLPAWAVWAVLLLLLSATAAAALAALRPEGYRVTTLLLTCLIGGLIGLLSTPEPGPMRATIFTLAGSIVGANLLLLYLSSGIGFLREKIRKPWLQLGLRIAAAWLGAVAMMMTALAIAQR